MTNEIVFLFGAGASKGAGHILPCAPPLGPELYHELALFSPEEWGPSSDLGQYAEGLRNNFEDTMFKKVLPWYQSLFVLQRQRPMALFFSRFAPDAQGKDLYSRLLLFLRDKEKIGNSIFASLNYDCIFEQAAHRLELRVTYSGSDSDETGPNVIRVLKPHGSCNFITEDIKKAERFLIINPNFSVDCPMNCLATAGLENNLRSKFSDRDAAYYPVMSLYSIEKGSLVASGKIQAIRNVWSQFVSNASVVGVVGVRPNKDDMHIWDLLKNAKAKLYYVGSKEHYEIWHSANQNFQHLGETFAEGYEDLIRVI